MNHIREGIFHFNWNNNNKILYKQVESKKPFTMNDECILSVNGLTPLYVSRPLLHHSSHCQVAIEDWGYFVMGNFFHEVGQENTKDSMSNRIFLWGKGVSHANRS